MKILFFDTETTGKADFRSYDINKQPYLAQLGAILFDSETKKEICVIDVVVQPAVNIPDEVAKIHGITTEMATNYGVSRISAIMMFQDMLKQADLVVAHNINFDKIIMKSEFIRMGLDYNLFSSVEQYCTMLSSAKICRFSENYGDYKWPILQDLQETYKILVNEKGFEGAHSAIVDVRACMEIFFAIKESEEITDVA